MPFHWYFTSALPRALLGGCPLAAVGYLVEPRVRPFLRLVTAYIALYSFLPHKEVQWAYFQFDMQKAVHEGPYAALAMVNTAAFGHATQMCSMS